MIRSVLDTNILLRMASGGINSHLTRLWSEHQFDVLMSLATLTELRIVLSRPKIHSYIPMAIGSAFLTLIEERAVFVQPDLRAPTCRDPKDTSLIATAVGGNANFLVTADADLLDDATLITQLLTRRIRVVTGAQFLEELKI